MGGRREGRGGEREGREKGRDGKGGTCSKVLGGIDAPETTEDINTVFAAACRAEMLQCNKRTKISICRVEAGGHGPELESNFAQFLQRANVKIPER